MSNDNKKSILSVDDDPVVRELVQAILSSADLNVITAANALEAFQIIENVDNTAQLSCIILDVDMPGMGGLDVLSKLKLGESTKEIPVIMLSCKATPDDLEIGYQRGADYYIAKPFTREQLLNGVKLVTNQKE